MRGLSSPSWLSLLAVEELLFFSHKSALFVDFFQLVLREGTSSPVLLVVVRGSNAASGCVNPIDADGEIGSSEERADVSCRMHESV